MDFMEDVDEYLGLKEAAQSGKIKNRKRTLSVGSDEDDTFVPPTKVSINTLLLAHTFCEGTNYQTNRFFLLRLSIVSRKVYFNNQ